jgi:hypothetical protein
MANREKRTAGCIAKHSLQWAEDTVWAKSDARTGGASCGTDQKEEPRSVSFVASAKAGAGVQAPRPQFWMPASRAHDGEMGRVGMWRGGGRPGMSVFRLFRLAVP